MSLKIPRFPQVAIFDANDKQLIPNMHIGITILGIGKKPTGFITAYDDGRKYPVKVSQLIQSTLHVQILFTKGVIINIKVGNGDFEYEIDNTIKYNDVDLKFMEESLIPFVIDFVGLFFVIK